jgi:hypothetical protein
VEEMSEAPRNPDACWKWGRPCGFLPVCRGEDQINNNALYQDRVRKSSQSDGQIT